MITPAHVDLSSSVFGPEVAVLDPIVCGCLVRTRHVDVQGREVVLRDESSEPLGEIRFDGGKSNDYRTAGEIPCGGWSENGVEQIQLSGVDGYGEEAQGLLNGGDILG